jgi:hypothetical protein
MSGVCVTDSGHYGNAGKYQRKVSKVHLFIHGTSIPRDSRSVLRRLFFVFFNTVTAYLDRFERIVLDPLCTKVMPGVRMRYQYN